MVPCTRSWSDINCCCRCTEDVDKVVNADKHMPYVHKTYTHIHACMHSFIHTSIHAFNAYIHLHTRMSRGIRSSHVKQPASSNASPAGGQMLDPPLLRCHQQQGCCIHLKRQWYEMPWRSMAGVGVLHRCWDMPPHYHQQQQQRQDLAKSFGVVLFVATVPFFCWHGQKWYAAMGNHNDWARF